MGYLLGNEITVDAILTKKGRELLARGQDAFRVAKFAVADDEIDYGLYDTAHPLGTAYYGNAIERLPIIEASPDETQNLRYKLVSLPRRTSSIPIITNVPDTLSLTYSRTSNPRQKITPETSVAGLNGPNFGYTAILYDGSIATIRPTPLSSNATPPVPAFYYGDTPSKNAVVVQGIDFDVFPLDVRSATPTKIVIIGNETGATATITLTVNPATTTNG